MSKDRIKKSKSNKHASCRKKCTSLFKISGNYWHFLLNEKNLLIFLRIANITMLFKDDYIKVREMKNQAT